MSLGQIIRETKRGDTIVSGPYRAWLGQHMDEPLPDWVIERISEQLRSKPRDRRASFSASSGGQCLRRRELGFLGVEPALKQKPDARLLNIFHDGKWRHLRWQASLLASTVLTDIEVRLTWPNMRHIGTMDGAGVVRSDHPRWAGLTFGLELKGMNAYYYDRYVRLRDTQMDTHKGQVDEYFLSGGLDLFVILYEDKLNGGWKEWVVEPDFKKLREARNDLKLMNDDIDREQLRPMLSSCRIRKGDKWKSCPFAGAHGPCELAGDWPA